MNSTPPIITSFPSEADQLLGPRSKNRLCLLWHRLDVQELLFVRVMVAKSRRHPRLMTLNALINLLGNGWLYLPLVVVLFALKGWQIWRFILAASLSVGIAHLLYPRIKAFLARRRPHDLDPNLKSSVRALDEYSCPSGYCMTAMAVGLPLMWAFPGAAIPMTLVWFGIAWSRLSLGHHYPTDLLLGAVLGAAVALPVAKFLL